MLIPTCEPPTAKNRIEIIGAVARVSLSQGHVCLIDAADVPLIAGYRWYAKRVDGGTYQAAGHRRDGGSVMHMSSLLLGTLGSGIEVDHVNHDSLDNRRANIRRATRRQNAANTRVTVRSRTGFKGVVWRPRRGVFHAQITIGGRQRFLGSFETAEGAARAFDAAALANFGEFAHRNFTGIP